MSHPATWNPLTDWKPAKVDWVRVDITPEQLRKYTERSNIKGLLHAIGFLLIVGATASLSYFAFLQQNWVLLAVALYIHGTIYGFFGNALHELCHNTVFKSKFLNLGVTALFGYLYWPFNPHHYRLSHQGYHHRYTLQLGTDGEDVPNYVKLTPWFVLNLFFSLIHPLKLLQCVYRIVTGKPVSLGWRGRGFNLDNWEKFILKNASDIERRRVYLHGWACLVVHVIFVTLCLLSGNWFLPIIITFAPFYGAHILGFLDGIHQHAACEANHPDFRVLCGDAKLDPLSSFLYWRMEYHIEHHMFAAIPCYNLKKFSRDFADQLPPKANSISRIFALHRLSKERWGSWQNWRDDVGRYKGY